MTKYRWRRGSPGRAGLGAGSLGLLFGVALCASAPASAQPVPAAIPLTGSLSDAQTGAAITGDRVLRIGLYASEDAEDAVFEEDLEVRLDGGRFTTYLGIREPLDLALFIDGARWVEIAVLDDDASGDPGEVFPRFPLGSVPYAAVAGFAYECRTLDGLDAADFANATHRHRWSDLDGVPASIADGITPGDGLAVDEGAVSVDPTVFQRRIVGTCGAGLAMRSVAEDGSVVCEPVSGGGSGGGYTAGDGIAIDGRVLSVADDEVTTAMHAWGPPLILPFVPMSASESCRDDARLGDAVVDKTNKRDFEYVGALAYDESDSDSGLRQSYGRARLRVMCRGNGYVEVVEDCGSTALASIRCRNTDRPKTATSDVFSLGSSAELDVRVRAISGDLEWAHPALVVY